MESWEGTEWKDTPKNRIKAEARAVLISEQIENGSFDYLKWFPQGNKAELFRPPSATTTKQQTVGEFFKTWIERKKPPLVRPVLHYDYNRQFRRYILPKFADMPLAEVTLPILEAFRSYLNLEIGLSLKSCRNIIDGTFRGTLSITKSRYMGTDSPTKTVASEREIRLGEPLVVAIRSIKPLHVTEKNFAFKNRPGKSH